MADILYTLGINAAGFAGGIASAVKGLGHVGLAMEGLKKISSGIASPILAAAEYEKTTTAINTLTKSAGVTARVMADLTKLSAETPFEMTELAPAARMLLGAGTATGALVGELRMLGDVAAGADTDLGGLVGVFNQIRGKTKLMGDDFIQLAERGVAGLREALAKVEGIEVSQVSKQMERGEISAADFTDALRSLTSQGGAFFNAMINQSQTFLGKLSTLSDGWNMLMVSFAAPINDALKPVIDDIGKSIDAIRPFVEQIGLRIGTVVSQARLFVTELGRGVGIIGALQTAFGEMFRTMGSFAMIPIEGLIAAMPSVAIAFNAVMGPAISVMQAMLMSAASSFGAALLRGISEALKEIPLMGAASRKVFDRMKDMEGLAETWTDKANEAAEALINGATTAEAHLKNAAGLFSQGMSRATKDALKDVQQIGSMPSPFVSAGMVAPGARKPSETTSTTSTGGGGSGAGETGRGGARVVGNDPTRRRINARIPGDRNDSYLRAQERSDSSRTRAEQGRAPRGGGLDGFYKNQGKSLTDEFKTPGLDAYKRLQTGPSLQSRAAAAVSPSASAGGKKDEGAIKELIAETKETNKKLDRIVTE